MSLTATWATRNAELQAETLVEHTAPSVTPPDGYQVVCEWRWRADPGDAWSAPTIQVTTPPTASATYDPPGDGWVQLTCYSTRAGLVSWQGYVHEVFYVGGGVYTPGTRITDDGERRITDAGDVRVTE